MKTYTESPTKCNCPFRVLDVRIVECQECGGTLPELSQVDRRILADAVGPWQPHFLNPGWVKAGREWLKRSSERVASSVEPERVVESPPVPQPQTGLHPLMWRPPATRTRSVALVSRATGELACLDDRRVRIRKNASLKVVLEAVPADIETIYLLGKLPGGLPSRFSEWLCGALPDGVEAKRTDHFLHGNRPVGRYSRDGKGLEVHAGSTWWGVDVEINDAIAAWKATSDQIAKRFRGAALCSTPAETGKNLLGSSWRWHKGEKPEPWPDLPEPIQSIVRGNTTQARSEFVQGGQPRSVVEVDGKFMYAAFLREIAHAPGIHIIERADQDDFAKGGRLYWVPGLYRVRFTVPDGWNHVGILPERQNDPKAARKWLWPSEPGHIGETWADQSELQLALKNPLGIPWKFEVLESITYSRRVGLGRSGPLTEWGTQLIDGEFELARQPQAAAMLRSMVRHTIGALGPSPHKKKHRASIAEAESVPDIAEIEIIDDEIVWTELVEIKSPEWSRPEWQRQIWARCRVAVSKLALSLPRDMLIAIETDALFLTETPELPKSTKPGTFRIKNRFDGPFDFHDSKSFKEALADAS